MRLDDERVITKVDDVTMHRNVGRPIAGLTVLLAVAGCSTDHAHSALPGTPDASTPSTFDATADTYRPEAGAPLDAAADAVAVRDAAAPPPAQAHFAYVGADDQMIHLYAFDPSTAALTPISSYDAGNYPSFLAFDFAHERVFATNENADFVAAFGIDPSTGSLTSNGSSATGLEPTYVAVDAAGRFVFTGNYQGGSAQVFPVMDSGSLGAATETTPIGMLVHCVALDPSNRFAFITAKGSDLIAELTFDAASGTLTLNPKGPVNTPTGAGPRHIAFHPTKPVAYVIDELDSMMRTYSFDSNEGTLTEVQALSTLPAGFNGTNTGAEVQVAPSGKFVYGSNRGADDLVVFAVDATDGTLSVVGFSPTGGQTPRHFSLDPSGQWLLVANQDSDNVVSFRVDTTAGTLTQLATTTLGASPYYVRAVALGP